jgi:uncharacterized protein involved in outer membrane biogenesis
MHLEGARIELPLPSFTAGDTAAPDHSSGAPVEIVSIDEIVLRDVEIISSGRTLKGDIEAVPHGKAVTLRRMTLRADDAEVEVHGEITDLAGPVGELALKAGALNLDRLMAFAQEFSSGAVASGDAVGSAERRRANPSLSTAGSPPINVVISLDATRATMGALGIEGVAGRVRMTDRDVRLDPLTFGVFGGRYDGALTVAFGGEAPVFRWKAKLTGVDVAAATRFAGRPETISGKLSGRLDLVGRGVDSASAIRTARGTARVDITNGVIKGLGLVRTVIVATSMRADAQPTAGGESRDERFSRLGATLAIAGATAQSRDLLMESENLRLEAAGVVQLDGSAVDLEGRVQLSDALSRQAGRDLVRYTQEGGRVTLPATITGPAGNLSVRIDVADVAKRAIRNRAQEEVESAIKKRLGGLFKRP